VRNDVLIRAAERDDWAEIWPFLHRIVAAGDTFAYDPALTEGEARRTWMAGPPARTVVAVDDGQVVGSATMYANRAGPGAHIASASFMVDPDHHGRGIGRALVRDSLDWAAATGFAGMQFNAVAASNEAAVGLYRSLGFEVLGTVPGGFRHPLLGDVGLHIMYRAV
jgi:L-amino acid N-acyltransferase YncA